MTFHGRSLDDLPLAAYSTGVEPDDVLDDATMAEPEPPAPPTFAPAALGASPDMGIGSGGGAATMARRAAFPALPSLPAWLVNPRANLRDPRLLMTGVIGLGVVLLVASIVLGGGPGDAANPGAAVSAPPIVAATPAPPTGDASVEVSGKLSGSYVLAGASGTGPASGGRIDATWSDVAGRSLTLSGAASQGTRTTDPTFTLTWTVVVDGAMTAFTSSDGECTVGMAVQPKSVTGSFVCKRLRSDDGALTIDVRGTYRT